MSSITKSRETVRTQGLFAALNQTNCTEKQGIWNPGFMLRLFHISRRGRYRPGGISRVKTDLFSDKSFCHTDLTTFKILKPLIRGLVQKLSIQHPVSPLWLKK